MNISTTCANAIISINIHDKIITHSNPGTKHKGKIHREHLNNQFQLDLFNKPIYYVVYLSYFYCPHHLYQTLMCKICSKLYGHYYCYFLCVQRECTCKIILKRTNITYSYRVWKNKNNKIRVYKLGILGPDMNMLHLLLKRNKILHLQANYNNKPFVLQFSCIIIITEQLIFFCYCL